MATILPNGWDSSVTCGLYWCATADHEEDWFILADSSSDAAARFADEQDYEPEEVHAEWVCSASQEDLARFSERCGSSDLPAVPDFDLIRDLGGELLSLRSPYVVRFGEHMFVEGSPDIERHERIDDALEAIGRGRPNGTRKHPGSPS